ncbi:MAG: hypothetical protein ACSHYA_16775 [Opitutaceae bacterium]
MKRLPIAIITILIAVVGYGLLRVALRPRILEVHTRFLFNQFDEYLTTERKPPKSVNEFLQAIEAIGIDWNSCKIEQQTIFDSWNRPIFIEFSDCTDEWSFHSSGANQRIGDSDDIIRTTNMD